MHNIVTEGYMLFMGYHTYYRIVGEASEKAPFCCSTVGRAARTTISRCSIVSPKVQFDLPRPFKLEKGGKRNDDTPQHEASAIQDC